jgi:hypothetical protein
VPLLARRKLVARLWLLASHLLPPAAEKADEKKKLALADKPAKTTTSAADQLGIPAGAVEGVAQANPSIDKSQTMLPSKKKKKQLQDRTAVGLFFSKGEQTAARQKMHTERIRHRRGHIRRRLQMKKTDEEKKAYAQRHKAISTEREDTMAAKQKQRQVGNKEKDEDEEWHDDLHQLNNIFSLS